MRTLRSRALLVTALLLLATACGGDGDGDEASSTTTSTTTASTTTTATFTGEGSEEFCGLLGENLDLIRQGSQLLSDPEQLGEQLSNAAELVREAASLAPAEIRPDVETLVVAYEDVLASVNEGSLDLNALLNPETAASLQRLSRYLSQVCGITL